MRILLIKPKHIGDSLLLTPTILGIRQIEPGAEIWVVVRRGCEGILAGCPEIDRLLTVAAVDRHERRAVDFVRALGTMLRLLATKFDLVFELGDGHRARLLARLARTRRRYSVKPATPLRPGEARRFTAISSFDWETCHRVEKDYQSVREFLPLPVEIPPLRFDRRFARAWPPAQGLTDFVVMQIGKRQSVNRWMRAGWLEVGRWVLERVGGVIIASGPGADEVGEAVWLQEQLGAGALATRGQADWPEMAGLLFRARLYVGLDTATMHLAAACGCPVVALFGSTYEGQWRPWRARHRLVAAADVKPSGDPKADLARAKRRSIRDITSASVIAACEEMLGGEAKGT